MSQAIEPDVGEWTAADLAERFGPMPLSRIRFDPPPGAATEADVVEIHLREDRLYELVDGVLVEKTMGTYEAYLATVIVELLSPFVRRKRLGFVLGADGMMRLAPDLVRIPDVSFISWDRLPSRRVPRTPIAKLAPDLAIEVISRGNTRQEMERKLGEYFAAGVRLVWYIYPGPREAWVYTSAENHRVVHENESLDGGDVLPGFTLPLAELFAEPEGAEEG